MSVRLQQTLIAAKLPHNHYFSATEGGSLQYEVRGHNPLDKQAL